MIPYILKLEMTMPYKTELVCYISVMYTVQGTTKTVLDSYEEI